MAAEADYGPAKAWLDAASPLYCADASGNLVFRNHAFDEIAPALFGDDGVADATQPTKAAAPRALLDIFNQVNGSDEAVILRQCITLDGAQRYYLSHHLRITGEAGFTGYGGSYTDITAEIGAAMPVHDATQPFQVPGPAPGARTWEADKNLKLTYVSDAIAARFELPESLPFGGRLVGGDFMLPFRDRILLVPDSSEQVCRLSLSGFPVFDPHTGECTGYRGTATELPRDGADSDTIGQSVESMDPGALTHAVVQLREQNMQLESALTEARLPKRASPPAPRPTSWAR